VATDLAQIAYEASQRALDKQERLLDEIRSRTGLLLAASSLAASFLGRPALEAEPASLAVLALVAFLLSIATSIYVLLPKRNLVFSLIGSTLYEALYEFRADTADVHRRLAYQLDRFWVANDTEVQRILWAFRISATGLALEIVLLLTGLTGTLF
jgi:hypothetical protein